MLGTSTKQERPRFAFLLCGLSVTASSVKRRLSDCDELTRLGRCGIGSLRTAPKAAVASPLLSLILWGTGHEVDL